MRSYRIGKPRLSQRTRFVCIELQCGEGIWVTVARVRTGGTLSVETLNTPYNATFECDLKNPESALVPLIEEALTLLGP